MASVHRDLKRPDKWPNHRKFTDAQIEQLAAARRRKLQEKEDA